MDRLEALTLIRWLLNKYGHNGSLKMAVKRLEQFKQETET